MAACVCDFTNGFKERVNADSTAYCSSKGQTGPAACCVSLQLRENMYSLAAVECESTDLPPTSIVQADQRALVSCERNVWTPARGFTLLRDPLSKKPVSVVGEQVADTFSLYFHFCAHLCNFSCKEIRSKFPDINECDQQSYCCDSIMAQCSTTNTTDNPYVNHCCLVNHFIRYRT